MNNDKTHTVLDQDQFEMMAAIAVSTYNRRLKVIGWINGRTTDKNPVVLETVAQAVEFLEMQEVRKRLDDELAGLAEELVAAGMPMNVWIKYVSQGDKQASTAYKLKVQPGGANKLLLIARR